MALGEHTVSLGPFTDDYFLVVVMKSGTWLEVPFGAPGVDDLLEAVERKTGDRIELELVGSTVEADLIFWPLALKGSAVFERIPIVPKGLTGWLRKAFGMTSVDLRLSSKLVDLAGISSVAR